MTSQEAIDLIKSTDFGGGNGIIIEVRKEHLQRLGVYEAYKTVYPNSFHKYSNNHSLDFLQLAEAKELGIFEGVKNQST